MDPTVKGVQTPKSQTSEKAKDRNKDLKKTKLCVYYVQGKCGQGSTCPFAHNTSEIRDVPNLSKTALCTNFMNGNCKNPNCTYAHGLAELVKPPSFKKKMCVWFTQGKCRNGVNCGFVHNAWELREDGESPEENNSRLTLQATPGLSSRLKPFKSAGYQVDCDASTVAPSSGDSESQAGTDVTTTMRTKAIADENLFRMMAGRGSAPLQQQVKSMGMAIGDLQAKLCQMQGKRQASSNVIEGTAMQKQIDEMQGAITQLSTQCQGMEVGLQVSSLRTNPQPPPTSTMQIPSTKVPSTKVRSNVSMRQKALEPNDIGSPEKARPAQTSYFKHLSMAKCSLPFELRAAVGVLVVGLMVMVEVALRE